MSFSSGVGVALVTLVSLLTTAQYVQCAGQREVTGDDLLAELDLLLPVSGDNIQVRLSVMSPDHPALSFTIYSVSGEKVLRFQSLFAVLSEFEVIGKKV